MPAFPPDVLELLDREQEVLIETTRSDGSARRTVIWVVVDGDEVFVRSVRGERGRWYRDLLSRADGAIVAGEQRIAVRAVGASDLRSVERCSRALERKYRQSRSLASMLRDDVLPTTLRLEPA